MAFLTRLSRLMRADLHAILDRLEAPDLVLAQSVREMEQALDVDRRALARLERERTRLRERDTELARLLEQTEAALEDCLAAGEDGLARSVIRRRLHEEREAAALNSRLSALAAECETRRRRLAEQETRLADLRARAACLDETDETNPADQMDGDAFLVEAVRDSDVEVALLRAKRQREARA